MSRVVSLQDLLRVGGKVELDRAREEFLDALSVEDDQVIGQLRDLVVPPYKEFFLATGEAPSLPGRHAVAWVRSETSLHVALHGGFAEWALSKEAIPVRELDGLRGAVDEWCDSYNLGASWIRNTAIRMVRAWSADLEGEAYTYAQTHWFPPPSIGIALPSEEPRYLQVPLPTISWRVAESPEDITRELVGYLERKLKNEFAEVPPQLSEKSFPNTINTDPENLLRNIRWLVKFQVSKDGLNTISRAEGFSRDTVRQAVNPLHELLELPPRPKTKGGRPKGSKTGI